MSYEKPKLIFRKSEKTMNDLYKTLINGSKVLDFEKIDKMGFYIHLLITQRGKVGKTLNMKLQIINKFLETGKPSKWLSNTKGIATSFKNDFYKDLEKKHVIENMTKQQREFIESTKFKGNIEHNNMWNKGLYKGKPKDWFHVQALSLAELAKNSRTQWAYLVWDEFNVKFNQVQDPVNKFDSLIHSMEDLVGNNSDKSNLHKTFIFGNNKSLNNPIIISLGIRYVKHEITEVYTPDGKPYMLMIVPKLTNDAIKELDEENKDNPYYFASKQLGTWSHSYINESLYDDANGVERHRKYIKDYQPIYSVYHDDKYYSIYKVANSRFHCISVERYNVISNTIFIMRKRDMQPGYIYDKRKAIVLFKMIQDGFFTFEDVSTRELVINSLTK